MLYSIVHDPHFSASELNHHLQLISSCAYKWKMAFNPDSKKQAVEVIFSTKNMKCLHTPLFFNGNEVRR